MRWAQVTDTGLVRTSNEDSMLLSPEIGLFAVADGMGGHRAGEVASSMALQLIKRELYRRLKGGENSENALVETIKEANRSIYELSGQNPEWAGMGTTVTVCLREGSRVFIGQVGDSRAYMLRGGRIDLLTEDHSLVQELLKKGGVTEEQAFVHPQRNILTRAVGAGSTLEVDIYRTEVSTGDMLLLCTDGLTEYLRPKDILTTVNNSSDINTSVQNLLGKALSSGGKDNITIILIEF